MASQAMAEKWKSAVEQAQRESGGERVKRGMGSSQEEDSRSSSTETTETTQPEVVTPDEVPEEFRDRTYNILAQVDGTIRQALQLPEREGVDVEIKPGDTLRLAAELIAPWAYGQRRALSPESMALAGLGLLVIDALRDGGLEMILEATGDGDDPVTTGETEAAPEGERADEF